MRAILLIIMVLVFQDASYAKAIRLSLEEAVELGIKRSEDIQQAIIDIQKAELQIREAWSSLLPQISANVQSIHYAKTPILQFGGNAIPAKDDWELLSTLQLNQALYSFGRLKHALAVAKMSREVQSTAKEAVQREIRFAVEVAYFNTIRAKHVVQIAKDSLENAKANQRALQKRFQGGRVPRFDNIKIASDVASRVPIVSEAEKNLKLAFLSLNLLTELDTKERPILTTEMTKLFPELDEENLLDEMTNNPQLKVSQLAVEIADRQAKLAKAEHYPVISTFGTFGYSGQGSSVVPDDNNLNSSASVGIAINIPIFSGGAIKARHGQAVLDKVRAQIELKKQREQLKIELESSIEEYKTNIEKYVAAKEAVRLARQAYELTRTRYSTGGATRNDLNDSERALTNARIQQETALFDIYRNQASIKRFTKQAVLP